MAPPFAAPNIVIKPPAVPAINRIAGGQFEFSSAGLPRKG
jgi:galactose mutarotase-like enzyme